MGRKAAVTGAGTPLSDVLRKASSLISTGADDSQWDDRDAMVRAFTTAAPVLEL
jgi:hypothetical protein